MAAPPRLAVPLASAAAALLVAIAATAVPLYPTGGDGVPGRLGAAVLACRGDSDLSRVAWLRERAERGRLMYYVRRGELPAASGPAPTAKELVSTFGPAPAVLGWPAMLGLPETRPIDDQVLRLRARLSAALAIALAAALFGAAAGGILIRLGASELRAGLAAATATLLIGLGFAGAPVIGQALWQQTALAPLLAAATFALVHADQSRLARLLTPALLLVSVLVRPACAPLGLGLGVGWLLHARADKRDFLLAAGITFACAAPLLAWNLDHLGSLLPTGQLDANQRMTEAILRPTPSHVGPALAGLLVSPARGWLWFAPVALVGLVAALSRHSRQPSFARAIAAGALGQLFLAAMFFKWWGGLGFGPRLLAEATWVGVLLAAAAAFEAGTPRWVRGLAGLAAVWTLAVGLLGLLRFEPSVWETRRNPDVNPAALWLVKDSPIVALITTPPSPQQLLDAPPGPFLYCPSGTADALVTP